MKSQQQFDLAFLKGHKSYDTFLGNWWKKKSSDPAHRRAYRIIAEDAKFHLTRHKIRPRLLVDYACGDGGLLEQLASKFPDSAIVGLDGSEIMLNQAMQRLRRSKFDAALMSATDAFTRRGPHVQLVRAALPDFQLPQGKADAAFFLFPNMNYSPQECVRLHKQIFGDPSERNAARFLSRLPDLDNPKKQPDPAEIYEDMMYERAIAANIHRMLRKGGYWFKADYSNCERKDWSDLTLWRMLFSESAFDVRVEENNSPDRFQLVQDTFYRSQVIRDVYDQTRNPTDRKGGYVLSTFRARKPQRHGEH